MKRVRVVTLLSLVAAALLGSVDAAAAQGTGATRIGFINSREIPRRSPPSRASSRAIGRRS